MLRVQIWDDDTVSDDMVGEGTYNISQLFNMPSMRTENCNFIIIQNGLTCIIRVDLQEDCKYQSNCKMQEIWAISIKIKEHSIRVGSTREASTREASIRVGSIRVDSIKVDLDSNLPITEDGGNSLPIMEDGGNSHLITDGECSNSI